MKKKTTKRKTQRRAPGRRNKKLQAEGFRMPASLTLLMVMLFVVGILYLWCCSRTEALARQIKLEEQQLEDLRRQVAAEEVRWNGLIGPKNLRIALKTHQLNMNWPRRDQVIHIRDMALWESTAGEINVVGSLDRATGAYGIQ